MFFFVVFDYVSCFYDFFNDFQWFFKFSFFHIFSRNFQFFFLSKNEKASLLSFVKTITLSVRFWKWECQECVGVNLINNFPKVWTTDSTPMSRYWDCLILHFLTVFFDILFWLFFVLKNHDRSLKIENHQYHVYVMELVVHTFRSYLKQLLGKFEPHQTNLNTFAR